MPEKCPVAPRLSVIVPVYQVAPYLEKCVASILGQTFSDFEVLLVDDGSTDGSGAICDALAEQDVRVRVIHKANGGVSSARNAGLDAARGRYIGFVDADDWIEPAFYEKLVRNLRLLHRRRARCLSGRQDLPALYENTGASSPDGGTSDDVCGGAQSFHVLCSFESL